MATIQYSSSNSYRKNLKRTSTPVPKRRICIKHHNNLMDTYSYWFWCRNLEEQPLRLQLRGCKHPINGILNGNLVPFNKEDDIFDIAMKKNDKSDVDKLLSSILNKSKYKNLFKQAKNLFKTDHKDSILDLNEKFLLLKTK